MFEIKKKTKIFEKIHTKTNMIRELLQKNTINL